jgi:hypothetical protein
MANRREVECARGIGMTIEQLAKLLQKSERAVAGGGHASGTAQLDTDCEPFAFHT